MTIEEAMLGPLVTPLIAAVLLPLLASAIAVVSFCAYGGISSASNRKDHPQLEDNLASLGS